jgi:hypothetical protein
MSNELNSASVSNEKICSDLKTVCDNYSSCLSEISRQLGREDIDSSPFTTQLQRCLMLTDELHTLVELVRADQKVGILLYYYGLYF